VSEANPYPSPEAQPAAPSVELSADDKLWAMLANLSGVLGYATTVGQYVAPLIIYLVYKEKSKFVAFHALQALYFQLGILVIAILGILTCGIVSAIAVVMGIVYPIIVALKANAGEWYEYPYAGKYARQTLNM
jgi:uncharacterized Tic20 family protein